MSQQNKKYNIEFVLELFDNDKFYIDKLCHYVKRKYHITVKMEDCKDGYYNDDNKEIIIKKNESDKSKLYTLLHEIGHVILCNRDYLNYTLSFPFSHNSEGMKIYKNKNKIVDMLREEVLAWDEGQKLAERLNIKLDYKSFGKYRNKYIFSYIG